MMRSTPLLFRNALAGIFALLFAASSVSGQVFAAASPWASAHKAQARLVSGGAIPQDAHGLSLPEGARLAFIEIMLEPGWKTYWRTPGDAGGLPPAFDWSKSSNLGAAKVLYPAPRRFTDKAGHTLGYDGGLVLPIVLTAKRADAPLALVVDLQYGICKDVCIPVDAELSLQIAPDEQAETPAQGVQALEAVPRSQDNLRPDDPVLVEAAGTLGGASPTITIEARFPGGGEGADVFLEAPDSLYLPLPELKERRSDDTLVFEAKLGQDVDLALLEGKAVTATIVSATGASVATFLVK